MTELGLVHVLRPDVSSTEVAGKDELRTKVELLFHAWRRMEQDIKPDFNFADKFSHECSTAYCAGSGSVFRNGPDGHQGLPAAGGVSRRHREEQVEGEECNLQFGLRQEKALFIDEAEAFLLSALKTDPAGEGVALAA